MLVHQSGLSVNRSDKYFLGKDWSLSIIKVHTHKYLQIYLYFLFSTRNGKSFRKFHKPDRGRRTRKCLFSYHPSRRVYAERMPDGREFCVQRFAQILIDVKTVYVRATAITSSYWFGEIFRLDVNISRFVRVSPNFVTSPVLVSCAICVNFRHLLSTLLCFGLFYIFDVYVPKQRITSRLKLF